jgi:pimeloyl-ACP methyl ester carboxylesterase
MPADSRFGTLTDPQVRETFISTPRLRFGALEAGDPDARLVLCLHGFPDSAWTWRHMLPALADHGYHAVAPFLRGYAPTDLPSSGFDLAELGADVLALEETLRRNGRSVVIGHDWGAALVYVSLMRDSARWACAVAASVPPTDDSVDAGSLGQLRRSWYSFLFQLPDIGVPERIVAGDDMALIDTLWHDWSPGLDAPEEIARAKDALRPPGHLRAAITYYRESPTRPPNERTAAPGPPIGRETPLLYLHGQRDGCIGIEALERIRDRLLPTVQVAVLEDGGHFLQLEQPSVVGDLVLRFLAEYG